MMRRMIGRMGRRTGRPGWPGAQPQGRMPPGLWSQCGSYAIVAAFRPEAACRAMRCTLPAAGMNVERTGGRLDAEAEAEAEVNATLALALAVGVSVRVGVGVGLWR